MLTPLNETSVTRPGPSMLSPAAAFGAAVCSTTFSGRTPMVTSPRVALRTLARTATFVPATSTTTMSPALEVTGPVKRFDWPRKFATNAVRGSS